MKRATLVLATSVALFLSGASIHASAATRKSVTLPADRAVFTSSNTTLKFGDSLRVGAPLEGEFIPSSFMGSKGTKLPAKVSYDYSIPRTIKGMTGSLKGGGLVGIGLTVGLQYMLDQVGALIDESGQPVVITQSDTPVSDSNSYAWGNSGLTPNKYLTPESACKAIMAAQYGTTGTFRYNRTDYSPAATSAKCIAHRATNPNDLSVLFSVNRFGSSCPIGASYDPARGACYMPSGPQPLSDAHYDLMEAAARAKDSDWLRDRLKEHCEGSLKPQSCYESLRDSVQLTGPSEINVPGTSTTTTGPNGITTTNTNTKITITYGDSWYTYNRATTTTITNPDGSTETKTEADPEEVVEEDKPQEEQMPEISDAYKPYIDKLNDIKTDVAAPPSVVSPIGYSSWYSFGGGCSEITVNLPIMGTWSTAYCPYIYSWVRPILAFLFVVFTWHYCRELWSEAVVQARPM